MSGLYRIGSEDSDPFYEDDLNYDLCPSCKGKGTVNPLTAPKDFV